MTKPSIGALVLYATSSEALLPAIVVAVHERTAARGDTPESVNLQIFTDESLPNILHISDVEQSDAPESGKFHFAADVKPTKAEKATGKGKE